MMQSTSSKYAPPLLFAVLFAHACAPAEAGPDGGLASEVRKTDAFHGIELAGTLAVEAKVGPATRVEVIGDADQLPQVITAVKRGVLRIDTKGKLERSRLRVVVTAPRLEAFTISGTGDLRVAGLSGGAVRASIPGTGAMQLAGSARSLKLAVNGIGEVRAKDLVVGDAQVEIRGTAEAKVHATRSADLRISGTGAIRLHGNPTSVTKSISGTGVVDMD